MKSFLLRSFSSLWKSSTFHFILLGVLLSTIAHGQITNDQCLTCHGNQTLIKTITLSTGTTETVPLYVDNNKFKTGKHGNLQCVKCHTDITTMVHGPLQKTYGGWARFSAKNDTVTPGTERTRNYYTTAALSCSQSGCHDKYNNYKSTAHFTIFKQVAAHVRTVNGESVGEAYVKNDCNRCHSSCATCHFKSTKIQAKTGDVLALWDSLQFLGDAVEPRKTDAAKFTEWAMDWTTNVEAHAFESKADLQANNNLCRSCHIGYYKPPASGFITEVAPFPKVTATNIRRHPQYQELLLSPLHKTLTCANCHLNVHSYPGTEYDWQTQGDVQCKTCHPLTNHYTNHATVDCIACHFTGFAKSRGQTGHDVFRNPKNNRVRPLANKYNEAVSWYPHNFVKPDNSLCGKQCHYQGNLMGVIVLTSVQTSREMPSSFCVDQNYPNPFNSSTDINYQVSSRQLITVKVYDIYGKELRVLVNEYQDSGSYRVEFDGSAMPSGTYIYKLTAGKFSQTRKMLLMK